MTKQERQEASTAAAVSPLRCERLWTLQDVSAFLGVPVGTLYQWRVRGEGPPAFKVGRHVRFDPDRVRAWLDDSAA
jgi:excisionase family DNA binding protein